MSIETKIINMLSVYFTLLNLERGWKTDVLTAIQFKGGGCIAFKNKAEVTHWREHYERDLMGLANLADSHGIKDVVTQ